EAAARLAQHAADVDRAIEVPRVAAAAETPHAVAVAAGVTVHAIAGRGLAPDTLTAAGALAVNGGATALHIQNVARAKGADAHLATAPREQHVVRVAVAERPTEEERHLVAQHRLTRAELDRRGRAAATGDADLLERVDGVDRLVVVTRPQHVGEVERVDRE